MKILDMREQWIHTHVILDQGTLDLDVRTVLSGAIDPILKAHAIQYGYHVIEEPARGFSRLVVECVPLERVRDEIRAAIAAAIEPFPSGSGRNPVTSITIEGNR